MNFPVFLNKWIIGFKPIKYTPIWWWYRLMSHKGFRFDDYYLWNSFWSSLNGGYIDMNYQWAFEQYWGKGAKAERIVLSPENYDRLVEMLNEPPKFNQRLYDLMSKPAPWDEEE